MTRSSIVIPAYNAAATVERAIGSALEQTERDIEVLVIDDRSTDATAAIVTRMTRRDSRVHLLRQATNRGPAAARNRGIAHARGEWIALLDADDEFLPKRLETLLRFGDRQGADLVADNLLLRRISANDRDALMLPASILSAPRWMSAAEFVAGNIGSRHAPRVSYGFMQPIIRGRFLESNRIRYRESNRFGEDFLLYLDCLMHGARWWITPEALYRYNWREGTLTDVQSAEDLLRIRTEEDRLLRDDAMAASDRDLARALRRHRAVINHFYQYRAFADAVRTRSARAALRLLLQSPGAFAHIVGEALVQAPRVAMKALRGGYRDMHPSTRSLAEG
jgi:succinoglycan biosynthesis protein ExoO/succinoglycan biosynthesis protein ExoU